ncbi:MAG TPA: hypothetical protein VGM72_12875 [Micropepsaceae bacterium]
MPQTGSRRPRVSRKQRLWASAAVPLLAAASLWAIGASAADISIPDFSQGNTAGWISGGADLLPPPSGPGPVGFDPAHPHVGNNDRQGRQPTPRIGDANSPILQPWAAQMVKKANEDVLAGKVGFEAMSTCWPAGVPGIMVFTAEPIYFVQTPKRVTILYQRGPNQRRVYMNVPHSKNPKPSWYGESVGHYEGKTLVIDTIGMNDKTFVDNVRTPHTTRLHVVERYTMSDDGRSMDAMATVEDPGAFTTQWSAVQHYRRVTQPYSESVCAENNNNYNYFNLNVDPIPEAAKPDF